MLGAVFGGQVAAESAASELSEKNTGEKEAGSLPPDEVMQPVGVRKEAAKLLRDSLGIFRSGKKLEAAADKIPELIGAEDSTLQRNRLRLGQAVLLSALNRRESRGAHTRTDYPETDDEHYRKTTVAVFDRNEVKISFRDIPEKRGGAG